MKKSMIALAVLAATAGVAQAATSVTLYGRADLGYTNVTGTVGVPDATTGVVTSSKAAAKGLTQAGAGESRYGIKGEEDLGAGYAGTFQFEGRFEADTGEKSAISATNPAKRAVFDRESTVGLKTPFGAVRFGTSLASMERGIGFTNPGRRSSDKSSYSSAARHSNGAFYDHKIGAVSFGGDVTTRGGYAGNTESSALTASYGVYAQYAASGLTAGVGYQKDNSGAAHTKEFGLGLTYTFAPVQVGVSYAQLTKASDAKSKVINGFVGSYITANDMLGARVRKTESEDAAGNRTAAGFTYGLGYVHNMSKRTSLYANVLQSQTDVIGNTTDAKAMVWDLAVRHNF